MERPSRFPHLGDSGGRSSAGRDLYDLVKLIAEESHRRGVGVTVTFTAPGVESEKQKAHRRLVRRSGLQKNSPRLDKLTPGHPRIRDSFAPLHCRGLGLVEHINSSVLELCRPDAPTMLSAHHLLIGERVQKATECNSSCLGADIHAVKRYTFTMLIPPPLLPAIAQPHAGNPVLAAKVCALEAAHSLQRQCTHNLRHHIDDIPTAV
ncbi:hypothetical protein FHS03_001921 [Massilia violacea]|uniref:Uncharacterized protein n=1 Tax=Pseudoduganella violacea TaxID=1715466 RepID=A0A7W5B996_9BURK|nr:hypothetical protein [Pseudoduganella violacea]